MTPARLLRSMTLLHWAVNALLAVVQLGLHNCRSSTEVQTPTKKPTNYYCAMYFVYAAVASAGTSCLGEACRVLLGGVDVKL